MSLRTRTTTVWEDGEEGVGEEGSRRVAAGELKQGRAGGRTTLSFTRPLTRRIAISTQGKKTLAFAQAERGIEASEERGREAQGTARKQALLRATSRTRLGPCQRERKVAHFTREQSGRP